MKKYFYAMAISVTLIPAMAEAVMPVKAKTKPAQATVVKTAPKAAPVNIPEINTLKSYVRDDYRQLEEDKANGDIEAIRITEEQILIDKEMLKNAYEKHGLKYSDGAWADRSDRVAEPPLPQQVQPADPVPVN